MLHMIPEIEQIVAEKHRTTVYTKGGGVHPVAPEIAEILHDQHTKLTGVKEFLTKWKDLIEQNKDKSEFEKELSELLK